MKRAQNYDVGNITHTLRFPLLDCRKITPTDRPVIGSIAEFRLPRLPTTCLAVKTKVKPFSRAAGENLNVYLVCFTVSTVSRVITATIGISPIRL